MSETLLWGKARLRAFQPNDGAYVRADAFGWQMLLDFKCPEKFITFSVSEVLSGQVPPDTFRGKIVLVGINAPSVSDERVTPIRRDHRGIRMQALTIHQLLRHVLTGDRPLRSWSDWIGRRLDPVVVFRGRRHRTLGEIDLPTGAHPHGRSAALSPASRGARLPPGGGSRSLRPPSP